MFSNENNVLKIDSRITLLAYNPLKMATKFRTTPGSYMRIFTVHCKATWQLYYAIFRLLFSTKNLYILATAYIIGGHHFVTFDGHVFDFAANCEYLLARDFHEKKFTITAAFKDGLRMPELEALKIHSNDHLIEMHRLGEVVLINESDTHRQCSIFKKRSTLYNRSFFMSSIWAKYHSFAFCQKPNNTKKTYAYYSSGKFLWSFAQGS